MKKIALLLTILAFGYQANSQILISLLLGDKLNSDKLEFGLDGGLTLSKMENSGAENLRTFNLGFYFDFKFKNNPQISFNTGVQVKTNLGAHGESVYNLGNAYLDSIYEKGEVTRRLSYFNVPILLKYTFKNNIFIHGGIQAGLRTKATDTFKKTIYETDDSQFTNDIKDNVTRLDGGASIGLGYRLLNGNGMNMGVRYYHGLVDVIKNDGTLKQYNRAIYFNVGIPIGKSPKPKN